MVLYDLAANCDYGDMQSEMIRDRLEVGIRDSALSESLQTDAALTLEKAKTKIRQRELKGTEPKSLEAILGQRTSTRRQRNDASRSRSVGRGNFKPNSSAKTCTRCRKDAHPREKCPAKAAECHRCKRKGHYGAMCLSKTVAANAVEADLTCIDVAFLYNVSPATQETAWVAHIQLNNQQTLFKLDTGAEVTAISGSTHQSLGKPMLNAPEKILCMAPPDCHYRC